MLLHDAIARSAAGAAIRSQEEIGSIISSTAHGTYLLRTGGTKWELRPEFENRTKDDWEPCSESSPMLKAMLASVED